MRMISGESDIKGTQCLDAHVLGDNEANLDAAFEAFSVCVFRAWNISLTPC
jgi:hypothetical protein